MFFTHGSSTSQTDRRKSELNSGAYYVMLAKKYLDLHLDSPTCKSLQKQLIFKLLLTNWDFTRWRCPSVYLFVHLFVTCDVC